MSNRGERNMVPEIQWNFWFLKKRLIFSPVSKTATGELTVDESRALNQAWDSFYDRLIEINHMLDEKDAHDQYLNAIQELQNRCLEAGVQSVWFDPDEEP